MRLVFTESAWEDYLWFQEKDRQLLKRINQLIKDTLRTPFEGIGKPEALKADLSGYWSRRIDDEHRLVYGVTKTEPGDYFLPLPLLKIGCLHPHKTK